MPIEGTNEAIEPSWDGPCAVCGGDADDNDEDWGCWSSHRMSVQEYRVTRAREDDRLRSDAADDSWVSLCSDACERVAFPEDFIADQTDRTSERTRTHPARCRLGQLWSPTTRTVVARPHGFVAPPGPVWPRWRGGVGPGW